MRRLKIYSSILIMLFLFIGFSWTEDFSGWKFQSEVPLEQQGLVRFKLSPSVIGSSRPDLFDLRLADSNGALLPFVTEEPREEKLRERKPKEFKVSMEQKETVVMVETGAGNENIERVVIHTPSMDFLKSVTLEGSQDQKDWASLAVNEPFFSKHGCDKRGIAIAPSSWGYLRIRIQDEIDQRIPISGVSLFFARKALIPRDAYLLPIKEQIQDGSHTYFIVALPSKNLFVSQLEIISESDVYRRDVVVTQTMIEDNEVTDSLVSRGVIFQIRLPDGKSSFERVVPVEQKILRDELNIVINNGMSPPLSHVQIKAHVIPSYVLFYSSSPQLFRVYTGNKSALKPDFDLAFLSSQINADSLSVATGAIIGVDAHAGYQPKDVLPALHELAGPIDISNWAGRKAIQVGSPGVYELELDLETLSLAQPLLQDLRVVQDGRQIPYLLWRYGARRTFTPDVTPVKSDNKGESHYRIKLPYKNLALDGISCVVSESLFERPLYLFEEIQDERGGVFRRKLSQTVWMKKDDVGNKRFRLPLSSYDGKDFRQLQARLESDTLLLVIENRDNPPLHISDMEIDYRSPKIIFKPFPDKEAWLYFGNKKAAKPAYDIHLVKTELFEADKLIAKIFEKETLKSAEWWVFPAPQGFLKYAFWFVLGLVTFVLIFVIIKLLPRE